MTRHLKVGHAKEQPGLEKKRGRGRETEGGKEGGKEEGGTSLKHNNWELGADKMAYEERVPAAK